MKKKRGFSRGKRGEIPHDLFFNIFEAIIAVMVVFALINFYTGVRDQTIFEKNYISRDISTLLNVVSGAPGTVEYVYDEEIDKFAISLENSRVSATIKSKTKDTPAFYLYGKNNRLQQPNNKLDLSKEEAILITKSNDKLSISKIKK